MNWIVKQIKGSAGQIYEDHRILYHNPELWGVTGRMEDEVIRPNRDEHVVLQEA
jgi:hypothetical protein